MIIIGEKINGTRKKVAAAIRNRDSGLIKRLAREQIAAGATYLDLNAGTHPAQEPDDMAWLVTVVQEEVPDARLCLDSANPRALSAGIAIAHQLPLINSLSGEKERVEGVLPLAVTHKTELVILALDDKGIPQTAVKRIEIVRRLVALAREGGLAEDQLYIDPLVTTIAADNRSGQLFFEAVRQIRSEFPQAHITCGLSNISFGQPARTIINQAFVAMAIAAGMDCAICDPSEKGLRNSIYSAQLVAGQDPDCLAYNTAFRKGLIGISASSTAGHAAVAEAFRKLSYALAEAGILESGEMPAAPSMDTVAEGAPAEQQHAAVGELADALVQMQKVRVDELVRDLLEAGTDPMEILEASKGAMTEVGRLFETQEYFVPELILAGAMLKDISEAVKPYLQSAGDGSEKKGRVIIGTVQGDIHDIGKDIVVTMLEVNGYEVMDLGVDVPPSRFIEAAREFQPQVIGLSGFLTLAYDPMKETVEALKAEDMGHIKVMIGGGQIDDQVMVYTGADGWGLDAMAAVNFCNQWIA